LGRDPDNKGIAQAQSTGIGTMTTVMAVGFVVVCSVILVIRIKQYFHEREKP
jgi:hypothetical protein